MGTNGTLNAYIQPAASSGSGVTMGACRDSSGSPSPTSWHLIAACPTTVVSSSANTAIRRPLLANNAVAALPDVQERKSFASKMSGVLFPQKSSKIRVKALFLNTAVQFVDQVHCENRQFSSPPSASMILLPPRATSPITTSKQKGFGDQNHQQQQLEPQPAYSDGSNTYYVINLDHRGTTTTPAAAAAALASKGGLLHPHPQQSCLTPLAPGPDSSYV
ncbi:unnamed protein product [Hydatigera taeniaeformis]|uniref:Uncharacterized protein n=1 Tax=Hydatigena taeniaeformis TaxID=6205 RepID=A0A0R3WMG7_HYDTA|nr:unnamed protein product [Hydatigera taeniaeformis]